MLDVCVVQDHYHTSEVNIFCPILSQGVVAWFPLPLTGYICRNVVCQTLREKCELICVLGPCPSSWVRVAYCSLTVRLEDVVKALCVSAASALCRGVVDRACGCFQACPMSCNDSP